MTYTIDDVMPGDVVTFEVGESGKPGCVQRTVLIDNTIYRRDDRISTRALNDQLIVLGARIVDVRRRKPINWVAVPTDALLDLLAAWDELNIYTRDVWRDADEKNKRNALRAKVAEFIDTTRAEWDRAGINP